MARNAGFSIENNFSNGLVTEATGLNFPENAVVDSDNVVFDQTGIVSRRPGFVMEPDHVDITTTLDDRSYVEYLWESVAGDGTLTFFVQQIGLSLRFYRSSGGPTLSSQFVQAIDLTPFATDLAKVANSFCQFSAGLGRLVVTHPYCELFYVEYNRTTGVLTPTQFTLRTRDFKSLQPWPQPRQNSITPERVYNLYNQGWSINRQSEYYGKVGGYYPSDYEVWWLYKSPDAFGTEVFLTQVAISSGILNNLDRGNSPAPRGSAILNEFYQDRGALVGLSLPVVTSGANRPSTTEFHAGRTFFSGVNAQDYNQKIYFSQILEQPSQFGICYQENDPTSQYSSDLLPSDGGVIAIPEAGTIYKLVSLDNNLLVFATQGVWAITGSQGIGFSATDYTVKKISSATTISPLSFIRVDGRPVWWSTDDIFTVMTDQVGSLQVKSLSGDRIKSLFQEIPEESKRYAKGAFNTRDRVAQWVFRSRSAVDPADRQNYTDILNLNVVTNAFYTWSVDSSLVKFKGISVIKGQGSTIEQENVFDNADVLVTDSLLNPVFVDQELSFTLSSSFKYVVVHDIVSLSFAELNKDDVYVDWPDLSSGPVNLPAFFVGGYRIRGDAIKKSQVNYIRVFVEGDKLQSLFFSSQWDYSNSPVNNRWSTRQRLEFDDDSFDYLSRRIKIRGHGIVCQFRVASDSTAGFHIIGWSAYESGNTGI